MKEFINKIPIILAIILYVLIFWLRSIQGGWELKTEVFKDQRNVLDQKIQTFLPSPQAELLSGILLGQNKSLPGHLKLALRDTSTLHIVVASGQNLSMVAGFFLSLAGLIKRKNAVILGLLAACLYSLLTGLQVPILRAAIMFSLASLAELSGRERAGWWVLLVTAGLMLLVNPSWLTDISFQLSFLSIFGVIVIAPVFLKWLGKFPLIGQDFAVSLAAQLMVTPIIAQNFHQFSLVGLITNVLVLWTVFFIMLGGATMLVVGTVWNFGGQLAALAVNALLTYFIYIVQFFSSLPFSWQYVGEMPAVIWLGYYLILISVVLSLIYVQEKDFRESQKGG